MNTILGQTKKNGQNITLPLIQFAAATTNRLGSGGNVRSLGLKKKGEIREG